MRQKYIRFSSLTDDCSLAPPPPNRVHVKKSNLISESEIADLCAAALI